MTNEKDNAKAQVLALFTQRLEALTDLYGETVGFTETYVVCTGTQAVYYREGQAWGVGVEFATTYNKAQAETMASQLRNGNHERGRIELLPQAVFNSMVDIKNAIEQVKTA